MSSWIFIFYFSLLLYGTNGKVSRIESQEFKFPPPDEFKASLFDSGTFVFTGIGGNYEEAIKNLRKNSADCLEETLEIELEDGTKRFTIARDSDSYAEPFPPCVKDNIDTITEMFDKVDDYVMDILETEYNTSLDITYNNETYHLEDLPTKSHLHVYQQNSKEPHSASPYSLPFHTDNGIYLLLTPSQLLPLLTITRNGSIMDLLTDDDSIIFLAGSGLTSWLLPAADLYAPPHAVRSMKKLDFEAKSRTVFARMKIAPLDSTNKNSGESFGAHFYLSLAGPSPSISPHSDQERRHQARLRRQAGEGHAQHWIGQSVPEPTSTESNTTQQN